MFGGLDRVACAALVVSFDIDSVAFAVSLRREDAVADVKIGCIERSRDFEFLPNNDAHNCSHGCHHDIDYSYVGAGNFVNNVNEVDINIVCDFVALFEHIDAESEVLGIFPEEFFEVSMNACSQPPCEDHDKRPEDAESITHTYQSQPCQPSARMIRAQPWNDGNASYIYIYIYIHTYLHISIHTCMHTYIIMFMYVRILVVSYQFKCMFVCHAFVHPIIRARVHSMAHICSSMFACMLAIACTHVWLQIHVQLCFHVCCSHECVYNHMYNHARI